MSVATTGFRHVELDERGAPVIAGAQFKVAVLIEQMQAWGWSAEQAHDNHPQLSLAQIYSALAYYYDHREQIDREIERHREEYDAGCRTPQPTPGRHALETRRKAAERA